MLCLLGGAIIILLQTWSVKIRNSDNDTKYIYIYTTHVFNYLNKILIILLVIYIILILIYELIMIIQIKFINFIK